MILVSNFTFSYHPREDRMIFIVNHDNPNHRLDFFVTRKKLIEFLQGFDEILIHLCDNGKIFKELRENQTPLKTFDDNGKKQTNIHNKNGDKKEDLQKNEWEKSISSKELNFTKNKKSILLDTISYSHDKDMITFKFLSLKKVYATSTMSRETFQMTLSSLMRVIPFVAWGISPQILD